MSKWFFLLTRLIGIYKPEPTPSKPIPFGPTNVVSINPPLIITQLLNAHNKERSKHSIAKLRFNARLQSAAISHAKWMSDNEAMSHKGVYGSSVVDRIKKDGYFGITIGENIARGYCTVERIMQSWMWSDNHRSNILQPQYIDCGMAKSDRYWCIIFGTPIIVRDKKDVIGFENYDPIEHAFYNEDS